MTTKAVRLSLLLALMSCDSHNDPESGGFPAAPRLGTEIDRMGRPAINTALTDPFWDDGIQTIDMHHAKQDAYNQASNPAQWATTRIAGKTLLDVFKANLAVYDGLDHICGNQVAFNGPIGPAYSTLATVLADDELFLDTTQTTCMQYLAVEANVLGIPLHDCGGRTLTENTVDITYNALASGMFTGPVTNGVTSDPDGSPNNTTFPYLGSPN